MAKTPKTLLFQELSFISLKIHFWAVWVLALSLSVVLPPPEQSAVLQLMSSWHYLGQDLGISQPSSPRWGSFDP